MGNVHARCKHVHHAQRACWMGRFVVGACPAAPFPFVRAAAALVAHIANAGRVRADPEFSAAIEACLKTYGSLVDTPEEAGAQLNIASSPVLFPGKRSKK